MRIKIGSFNVHGLGNIDNDSSFKEQKIEKISKILKDENFHLIVLQEIQDAKAVKRIASNLGGYESIHCADLYKEELTGNGFKNRNGVSFDAELAFLWNPLVLTLDRDPEIYKGISERIALHFDRFVDAMSIVIAGLLLNPQNMSKEEDKEEKEEKERCYQETRKIFGLLGVSGVNVAGKKISKAAAKKSVASVLHKTLRPPVFAIFKKCSPGVLGKLAPSVRGSFGREIRLINTHTQYGGKEMPKKEKEIIRRKELEFVLGEIYDVVATHRDGKWRSPTTIVAGDYNMSWKELQYLDIGKYHKNDSFMIDQRELSTLNRLKKDEPPKIVYSENYDHFSYDSDKFFPGDPVVSRYNATPDNFIVDNKLVSDHVPIEMSFEF